MISVTRLQEYLRYSAQQHYNAVAIPPFTLFFHPTDSLTFFNYAIPDQPAGGDLSEPLARLRAAFLAHDRRPRFEFIEAFAPDLAPALRTEGFVEESRLHLMLCRPDSYRPAPPVSGLTISRLSAASPPGDLRDYLETQRRGFEPDHVEPAGEAEVQRFRHGESGHYLARLKGEAAGAGTFSAPHDGLTEVAGIATLEPFRRRGIASAVTAQAVHDAFEGGVDTVLLTAGDERAGRVYERVGFQPFATSLAYVDPKP